MDEDEHLQPAMPSWQYTNDYHYFLFGTEHLGFVAFRPIALVGQRYAWECGNEQGHAKTLRIAKLLTEQAYMRQYHKREKTAGTE